jgi:hypothetical protein
MTSSGDETGKKERMTRISKVYECNGDLSTSVSISSSRVGSATDAISLPKPKPRAMREHFVVSSIRRTDVACAEWPNIRRFEHFL